jgi:hypothetical protein
VHVATPEPTANRPGLPALRARVGTHGSFLSSMHARLSSPDFPGLEGLRTRDPADPAIALLDAWASAADVLTFYQERLANEGYLRTATEMRSVLELARLVGYAPRPGVAASTYLAFELEKGHDEVLPAGTKAQSLPGPGELPQVFETSDELPARSVFNAMGIRMSRPQVLTPATVGHIRDLWLAGTGLSLQPNDPIAFVFDNANKDRVLRYVDSVTEDFDNQRTHVLLQGGRLPTAQESYVRYDLQKLIDAVQAAPPIPPKRVLKTPHRPGQTDAELRLQQVLHPDIADVLYRAWAGASATKPPTPVKVFVLRAKSGLFGSNAPERVAAALAGDQPGTPTAPTVNETDDALYTDVPNDKAKPGSVVAVVRDGGHPQFVDADDGGVKVDVVSRADYGLSGKSTRFSNLRSWPVPDDFDTLRKTVVYSQSEELVVADEPIVDDVLGPAFELDKLYEGLRPGRRVIVAGQRADVPGVDTVVDAELVTIAEVYQGAGASGALRRGDPNHMFVVLEGKGLAHPYRRGTVKVYGNVVHATHGQTKTEVLGGGDGTKAHQSFTLRSKPVTFVSAPTPSGVKSTLEIRVNDVLWPERPWFTGMGPADRGYVTLRDDAQNTTVIGPNGVEGRRYPTGQENLRARYRVGLGQPGNLGATQISQLLDKPLAVKGVVNPLPSTGGADPEDRDHARANAPLPIKALDRLVSVVDYADFSRTFAGVGKAAADRLVDGRRQTVVVTVAGADGTALDKDSDVVVNLRRALRQLGDPSLPVRVLVSQRLVLRLGLVLGIAADHEFKTVEPVVRAALLDRFSFDRQCLGEGVAESAVLACAVAVEGVSWARVDDLGFGLTALAQNATAPGRFVPASPAGPDDAGIVRGAQHLYLAPEIPELLAIKEAGR